MRARGMIETEGKLTIERAACKKCGNKTEFKVEIRTYSDSRQWVTVTCIKCDSIIVLRRTMEVYDELPQKFHYSGVTPEEEEIDLATDDKEAPPTKAKFECPYCGYGATILDGVTNHVLTHHHEKYKDYEKNHYPDLFKKHKEAEG